ncbi:MAG: DUF4298 domain-containing protein [Bacteroidaceae bacterium]|nr:DUF4298 domain-containing protein [Bacteroidaceae bacterium]
MKETINRIKGMEKRMRRADKVLKSMEYALDEWDMMNSDLKALNKYLGSEDWKADMKADEAGLLPDNLRRGVLSEDGIWNLLVDQRVLMQRLFEMIKNEQK